MQWNGQYRARAALAAAIVGIGLWASAAGASTILYQDTFSGSSTTNLAGKTPDITTNGNKWASNSTVWKADGSFAATGGTIPAASLPSTIASGNIYELSVDLNPTSGGVTSNWIGVGFNNVANFNFLTTSQNWALVRVARGTGQGQSFTNNTSNGAAFDTTTGPQNIKIVLDTTAPQWTANYFVNGVSVRGPVNTASSDPAAFAYIGFDNQNSLTGTVDNFTFSIVPEPASLGLLAVSGSLLVLRRRQTAAR